MRRIVMAVCVSLCALFWTSAAESRTSQVDATITSVALGGPMHALVVLPAGYETSGKRYPVVYFLHGLPGSSKTYLGSAWLARALTKSGPAILVEPQGALDNDTDPEYLDWGDGRNWATYLTKELPRYVDSRFRTIRSRAGRAIVGISAGGYGAAMLGLSNLGEFSVVESWSGYFHATDPTGRKAIVAPKNANVHHLISTLASSDRRRPTFLGFYVGRSDPTFVAENKQFDRELTAARVPHTFATYAGAHTTKLWSDHAVAWLRLALRHLQKPA